MAKFHGLEIKNYNTFMGMEGYGAQGDVWLNGMKLGFWSSDGNGGEDRFEFPHDLVSKLDALVAEQIPECAMTLSNGTIIDGSLSIALAHLADLKDMEKAWKKANKMGFALVLLTDRNTGASLYYQVRIAGYDNDTISELIGETAGDIASENGLGDCTITIFDDASCFTVGKPLSGAEEIIRKIVEWRTAREKLFDKIASKQGNVA